MTHPTVDQVPGIYRRRTGPFVVTVLNDGHMDAPLAVMPNIAPEDASALLTARFHGPTPRLVVHAFLVQDGTRTILIDTGAGANFGPTCGHLLANLAAAGVQPTDIDTVLLTHFHGDHSGGLATPGGQAVFPKADLAFPAEEAAYWLEGTAEAAAPEAARGSFQAARVAAAPYQARLRPITGTEVVPGITRVPLPGHTPGHSGYRIADGPDALLIWGDIMHVPDVQSARPDVVVGFDVDPAQAVASRRAILERAVSERFAVAGMHLQFPSFAHVIRAGAGYELVPEQWLPFV